MNRYNFFGTPLDVYIAAAVMIAALIGVVAYGIVEANVFGKRTEEENEPTYE